MKFMKLYLKELNNHANCSWIACLSSYRSQHCVIAYNHHPLQWYPCLWPPKVHVVLIGSHMGSNMEPLSMVEACFQKAGTSLKSTVLGTTYPFPDAWHLEKEGRWVKYVVGALESEDVSHLHFIEHLEDLGNEELVIYISYVLSGLASLFIHGEATSLMNEPCCFILWKHVQFVFNFVQRMMMSSWSFFGLDQVQKCHEAQLWLFLFVFSVVGSSLYP